MSHLRWERTFGYLRKTFPFQAYPSSSKNDSGLSKYSRHMVNSTTSSNCPRDGAYIQSFMLLSYLRPLPLQHMGNLMPNHLPTLSMEKKNGKSKQYCKNVGKVARTSTWCHGKATQIQRTNGYLRRPSITHRRLSRSIKRGRKVARDVQKEPDNSTFTLLVLPRRFYHACPPSISPPPTHSQSSGTRTRI